MAERKDRMVDSSRRRMWSLYLIGFTVSRALLVQLWKGTRSSGVSWTRPSCMYSYTCIYTASNGVCTAGIDSVLRAVIYVPFLLSINSWLCCLITGSVWGEYDSPSPSSADETERSHTLSRWTHWYMLCKPALHYSWFTWAENLCGVCYCITVEGTAV